MKNKLYKLILVGLSFINVVIFSKFSVNAYSEFERIEGRDRYDTSLKVSSFIKTEKAVLASGKNFADALSSVNISNRFDAMIILTDGNTIINSELKNRGIKKVYIIGGNQTIPKSYETNLKMDFKVERIAGKNRYETSKKTIDIAGYSRVGIADGRNYPDALSAAPLLNQEALGLLLVEGNKSYQLPDGISVKYTFGGESSVKQDGGERINGTSRYETAIKISQMISEPQRMVVVSGKDYADALSSSNFVILDKSIIMPVPTIPYYDVIKMSKTIDKLTIVGGKNSVNKLTENILLDKNVDNSGLSEDERIILDEIELKGKKIINELNDIENAIKNLNDGKDISIAEKINKIAEINKKIKEISKEVENFINKVQDKINKIKDGKEKLQNILNNLKLEIDNRINFIKEKIKLIIL